MAIEILDKGACKAAGVVDTLSPVGNCRAQGIRSVLSLGPGSIRLTLVEGIGQAEFTWEATCEVRSLGQGITANCVWIDPFTIELQTYDQAGVLAAAVVSFFFFLLEGLGRPALIAPPPPDPLAIFGQAGLVGWWRADAVDGSPTSSADDLSGNGNPAVQAVPGQQPTIVSGQNAQPAWNLIRANSQGLQAAGLVMAAASRPCGFIVAQSAGPHTTAAHSSITAHDIPALTGFQEGTEPFGAHTGWLALADLTDGTPLLESAAAADDAPHLFYLLLDPTGARFGVDGAEVAAAEVGGLTNGLNYTSIGSTDPLVAGDANGWNGLVYERFITVAVPSPSQLAAVKLYFAMRYALTIA